MDGGVTREEWSNLESFLEERFGTSKLITIAGLERMMVVKAEITSANLLRNCCAELKVGNTNLRTVLTSGSLGKLKSVAKGTERSRFGKVSQ